MSSAHITFDKRSGQIVGMHHGSIDISRARQLAARSPRVNAEHIAVISVPARSVERGKLYKVDVKSHKLVEVTRPEKGAGFGFGGAT